MSTPSSVAYCGSTGSITGPGGITEIFDWTVNLDIDTHDVITMDSADGWVNVVGCLKGGSGSYKSYSSGATVGPIASIHLNSKSSGGVTISGAIIVNKCSTIVDVAGLVTWENSFVFSGDIAASGV